MTNFIFFLPKGVGYLSYSKVLSLLLLFLFMRTSWVFLLSLCITHLRYRVFIKYHLQYRFYIARIVQDIEKLYRQGSFTVGDLFRGKTNFTGGTRFRLGRGQLQNIK
uniref:Uncharacterized protein n=1 Tax=Cacopsylla melanoneura TaxID=428564 RepID=A0A8D9FEU0_9HEMI